MTDSELENELAWCKHDKEQQLLEEESSDGSCETDYNVCCLMSPLKVCLGSMLHRIHKHMKSQDRSLPKLEFPSPPLYANLN